MAAGRFIVVLSLPFAFAALACSTRTLTSGSDGAAGTGATGDDGAADSESSDGGSCPAGTVTFQLGVADPTGWFWYDSGQGCSPSGWLSIHDSAGAEILLQHCCTVATCGTCSFQDVVCQSGWTTPGLPVTETWDGTMFPAGTCGASLTGCVMDRTCAGPGHYVAHMCAYRSAQPIDQMACVDVPFDLPASAPVVGMLTPEAGI